MLGFLNVEDKSHILVNTFEEMKKVGRILNVVDLT